MGLGPGMETAGLQRHHCDTPGQTVSSLTQETPLQNRTDQVPVPALSLCGLGQVTSSPGTSRPSSVKWAS